MSELTDRDSSSTGRDILAVAIIAITALVLGANLFMLIDDGATGSLEGDVAPSFELEVLGSDKMMSVEKYRGQVIVIDFWATWCPPCREQMPVLEKVATDPELDGEVVVLSVNTDPETDDRRQRVEAFLREEELTLPTVIDTGEMRAAYRVTTIPTLVVVTPSGEISHVSEGLHDEETLRNLIARAGGK